MTTTCRAVLGFLLAIVGASAVAAAPAITLSADQATPTASVTVSATGFPPRVAVDFYFDLSHTCLVFSGSTGAASCVIKVPRDATPQQHWISVMRRYAGTGAQLPILVRTNWSQHRGLSENHQSSNPLENVINTSNVGNLEERWRQRTGLSFQSSPIVQNGVVYAVTRSSPGKIYAYSAQTGLPAAGYPLTLGVNTFVGGPAVQGLKLYAAGKTAGGVQKAIGINVATRAALPGFPATLAGCSPSANTYSAMTGAGTVVFSCENKVYAFNTATGAARPGFPVILGPAASELSALAMSGDHLYAGSSEGAVHGVDINTGAALTGYPLSFPGLSVTAISIASGKLFFTHIDGKLYGYREGTAVALPGYPITVVSNNISSLAVANGRAYVDDNSGHMRSYRTTDGQLMWTSVQTFADYGATIANGVLFSNQIFNRVYAYVALYGGLLWSTIESVTNLSPPVISDGQVIMATYDGDVVAYSVDGAAVTARSALGSKPGLAALRPSPRLKAVRNMPSK